MTTWILTYVAYAFIQGAVFVRCFEKYTHTRFAWPGTVHSIVFAATFAPAITALALVAGGEWV